MKKFLCTLAAISMITSIMPASMAYNTSKNSIIHTTSASIKGALKKHERKKGQKQIEKGKKLEEKGQSDIKKGNTKKGQKEYKKGQKLIQKGEKEYKKGESK